jgi:predicted Zn-dependent protease
VQSNIEKKPGYIVRIDETFGKENISLIEKAICKWGNKLDVDFNFIVVNVEKDKEMWSGDHIVTIYFSNKGWKKKTFDFFLKESFLESNQVCLGMTISPSRDIFIPTKRELYKVSMHEFGHVLGCSHSNSRFSIMFDHIHSGNMFIMKKDLEQARKNF